MQFMVTTSRLVWVYTTTRHLLTGRSLRALPQPWTLIPVFLLIVATLGGFVGAFFSLVVKIKFQVGFVSSVLFTDWSLRQWADILALANQVASITNAGDIMRQSAFHFVERGADGETSILQEKAGSAMMDLVRVRAVRNHGWRGMAWLLTMNGRSVERLFKTNHESWRVLPAGMPTDHTLRSPTDIFVSKFVYSSACCLLVVGGIALAIRASV